MLSSEIRIQTASRSRLPSEGHATARYTLHLQGRAPEHFRRLTEAKHRAVELLGQPVKWAKRDYTDGSWPASEWTPTVTATTNGS